MILTKLSLKGEKNVNYLELAQSVLSMEAKAIEKAAARLKQEEMDLVVEMFRQLRSLDGHLVFCGVGKSGVIAQKLTSTFCSLGLPSYFLHPVEALHGDLGRVRESDLIVLISKSGTTEEIMKLIPFLNIKKAGRIGLLGVANSPIGEECGVVLDCSVEKEACINNQAPTTSSTLALAMGDALAVVYESLVGLSREGFAVNHPGGLLGKRLRIKVQDLMWDTENSPILHEDATLKDAILAMTNKPIGACAIVSSDNSLLGILVEGDIRRAFTKAGQGLDTKIIELMKADPIIIEHEALAYDALVLMESRERPVNILPVLEDKKFLGFIRLHDLVKEGFLSAD